MEFDYIPQGVCAKKFHFTMDGEVIRNIQVEGGCPGNLLGIGILITDKQADEVIKSFEGVKCRDRTTSCPEQIALALKAYKNETK